MRAIGYVRRRVTEADVEALDVQSLQELAGSIDAVAGFEAIDHRSDPADHRVLSFWWSPTFGDTRFRG